MTTTTEVAQAIRQLIANHELEDFSRFVEANPTYTVKTALEMFEVVQGIPF